MRWLKLSLLSLTLGLSGDALAGPESPESVEAIVEAVESTYKDVESLQANFVQVTRSLTIGEEQEQKGSVVLQRPKRMRWDFTSPDARLFVTDGQEMWIYAPSDNQAMVYPDTGSGTGMESLLTDLSQISEFFNVEKIDAPAGGSSVALKLTPREEASFKYLKLTLSQSSYEVQQVVVVDTFDNETALSFSDVQLNGDISGVEFSFVPPDGVEVIRQ